MKIITYRVNEQGLREIEDFLKENHKLGSQMTQEMLVAWALDAEHQLCNGNPPSIEIKAWDSVYGRTQEFTLSSDGFDVEVEDIGD